MFLVADGGAVNPVVLQSNTATTGILSSKRLLRDPLDPGGPYDKPPLTPTNAAGFFNYLKTVDAITLPAANPSDTPFDFSADYIKANAGPDGKNQVMLAYVDQGLIARLSTDTVFAFEALSGVLRINNVHRSHLDFTRTVGAVSVLLQVGGVPRSIDAVIELP